MKNMFQSFLKGAVLAAVGGLANRAAAQVYPV
jgi:hypothetical protein